MLWLVESGTNLCSFMSIYNLQENYAYATIGGTCFLKKTHVELYMKLERNTFKLGETIPVHVECRLEGGNADVDKVRSLFVLWHMSQNSLYVNQPDIHVLPL